VLLKDLDVFVGKSIKNEPASLDPLLNPGASDALPGMFESDRREPCAAGWTWGVSVQFVVRHISHRMSRAVREKVTYTSLDHTVPREEQDRVA